MDRPMKLVFFELELYKDNLDETLSDYSNSYCSVSNMYEHGWLASTYGSLVPLVEAEASTPGEALAILEDKVLDAYRKLTDLLGYELEE